MSVDHSIIGTYKRDYVRGQVLRGFDTQNPTTRTLALPVHEDPINDPTIGIIHQGMVVSINTAGTEWVKGVKSGTSDTSVVAVAHTDSYEDDVLAAGGLLGLQCSGQYRFATPFFKHYTEAKVVASGATSGQTNVTAATLANYKVGTQLAACGNDETDVVFINTPEGVKAKTVNCAGYVRPAKSGDVIIGVVAQTQYGPYIPWEGGAATAVNRDLVGYALNTSTGNVDYIGTDPIDSSHAALQAAGVWPLQTTIGSQVDSSSQIYNSYFLVWDSAQTGATKA